MLTRALRIFAFLSVGLFLFATAVTPQEIELTTYYPSPVGVYRDIDVLRTLKIDHSALAPAPDTSITDVGIEIQSPAYYGLKISNPSARYYDDFGNAGIRVYGIYMENVGITSNPDTIPAGDAIYITNPGRSGIQVRGANGIALVVRDGEKKGLSIMGSSDPTNHITQDGIWIQYMENHGIVVSDVDAHGVIVQRSDYNGMVVRDAELAGLFIDGDYDNDNVNVTDTGLQIRNIDTDGISIDNVDNYGLNINNAYQTGLAVHFDGTQPTANDVKGIHVNMNNQGDFMQRCPGIFVENCVNGGVRVKNVSDGSGLLVENATFGMSVNHTTSTGIPLYDIGGIGIVVNTTGAEGIRIDNTQDNGISINDATKNGIEIDNPDWHGIKITSPGSAPGHCGIKIVDPYGYGVLVIDPQGRYYDDAVAFNSNGPVHFGQGIGDYAEYMQASEELESGTIVEIGKDGKVKATAAVFSDKIVGVVSTNPTVIVGGAGIDEGGDLPSPKERKANHEYPIGFIGQTKVKICLEGGEIKAGDYITSSSKKGMGMKANLPGRVVGMAMEDFSGEGEKTGEILLYLNAQYYTPGYAQLSAEISHLKEELASLKSELR